MGQSTQADLTANRNFIYGQGNNLNQQNQDAANNYGNVSQYYQDYGQDVNNPLIAGQGGYSPEEQQAILQQQGPQGLSNLPTNPTDQSQNFLNDTEQQSISGNPSSFGMYFDPESATDIQARGAQAQNAAVDVGAGNQNSAVGQLQSGLQAPLNNPGLLESSGYTGAVNQTLGNTAAGVHGAVDLSKLRQDPGYAAKVEMTPQQQQDIVSGAGISAGTGYRAAAGDLARQTAAAGTDPAGAAVEKERLLHQAGGAAADAETEARIGASNAAAAREASIEAGRRAGETSAAQIGSQTALALGTQNLSAQDRLEATRLGAQQNLAGLQEGAASEGGEANLATQRGLTNTQLANQENITQGNNAANQFNEQLGTGIATNQDQAASQRAAQIAGNRQQTQIGNEGQAFNQGMAVNSAASARNAQIANQQQNTAAEGRNWLYNQQGQANQNQQTALNRQQGIYGTEGSLAQGQSNQQLSKDTQPGTLEKIGSGIIGAAGAAGSLIGGISKLNQPTANSGGGTAKGGVFTRPTNVTVGEEGPEMVVPLSGPKESSYGRPRPKSGVAPPGLAPRSFIYGKKAA